MIIETRTARTGFATLLLTAGVLATAGQAAADIPLTPAATEPAATVAETPAETPVTVLLGSAAAPLVSFSGWAQANNLPDVSPLSAAASGSSGIRILLTPIFNILAGVICGADSISGGTACATASAGTPA
ncbi:hypothetical protein [Nocardia sp. NPDC056000]|uniref:hypothetical protein n=1 Tax=Nocardia sp. NPDC056000 TaxID=3345674 RepID=UPI0035E30DD0